MCRNGRCVVWFVLAVALALLRTRCNALEQARASGRKLHAGVTAMDYNHLFGRGSGTVTDDLGGAVAAGESVKFSASKQHVLDLHHSLRKVVDATSSGNWRPRKPLPKPLSASSRSRINNRSMTRFSEVEIPAGMQQIDAPPPPPPPPQPPAQKRTTNVTGLAELFRSAEKSRGIENFFWKYFVDSDVSASIDDDDEDDGTTDALDAEGNMLYEDGGLDLSAEARKKKFQIKKKYKKFLIPLLLAYKIKFLALVPAIIGGLILLVKSAGLAGFFFALFTAVVSLKKY